MKKYLAIFLIVVTALYYGLGYHAFLKGLTGYLADGFLVGLLAVIGWLLFTYRLRPILKIGKVKKIKLEGKTQRIEFDSKLKKGKWIVLFVSQKKKMVEVKEDVRQLEENGAVSWKLKETTGVTPIVKKEKAHAFADYPLSSNEVMLVADILSTEYEESPINQKVVLATLQIVKSRSKVTRFVSWLYNMNIKRLRIRAHAQMGKKLAELAEKEAEKQTGVGDYPTLSEEPKEGLNPHNA